MTETILVIDDQENVRGLLKDYLTSQGYRVVLAADGQAGLFMARYEHPDLVLLDVMMPAWTVSVPDRFSQGKPDPCHYHYRQRMRPTPF